jgi:hypothetical protein
VDKTTDKKTIMDQITEQLGKCRDEAGCNIVIIAEKVIIVCDKNNDALNTRG